MHSASVTLVMVSVPLRNVPRLMETGVPRPTCGGTLIVATSNSGACAATQAPAMHSISRHRRMGFTPMLDTGCPASVWTSDAHSRYQTHAGRRDRRTPENARDPGWCSQVTRGEVVAPNPGSLCATFTHSIALMRKSEPLKTRLLREAVEDNVATISGPLAQPLRRGRRLVALWGPRAAALLLLLSLVGALRLVPGIGAAGAQ